MADVGYSPATATAISWGSTDVGRVETTDVGWDAPVALTTLRGLRAELGGLLVAIRDVELRTRLALRAGLNVTLPARTVMAVGDSTAHGNGSSDVTGWRGWLTELLDGQGYAATVPLVGEGGGLTLADVAALLPGGLAQYNPQVVAISVGTNDAAAGGSPLTTFGSRYSQLVDAALAYPGVRGVVCLQTATPAPWVGSWVASNIPTVRDAIAAAVAAHAGQPVVMVNGDTPLQTQAFPTTSGGGPSATAAAWQATGDGIHCSDWGYQRQATLIQAALIQAGWLT